MKIFHHGGWLHRSRHHPAVRLTGKAIRHTSTAVHRLLVLGIGALVLATGLLAALAVRLSQGPIELGWLAARAAAAQQGSSIQVSFDHLALVWEGFNMGIDHPLDITATNVVLADAAGHPLVQAPAAHVTFSLAGLFMGRMVPRSVELDRVRLPVVRRADGSFSLGSSAGEAAPAAGGGLDPAALLAELSGPEHNDRSMRFGLFEQLQRVHFRDATVDLRDEASGFTAAASGVEFDLSRLRNGQIAASLNAPMSFAGQSPVLTARAILSSGGRSVMDTRLTAFQPSTLAPLVPRLAALALPVALTGGVTLGPDLGIRQFDAKLTLGEGHIVVGEGTMPMLSGNITLSGTPDAAVISDGRFVLARSAGGLAESAAVSGAVAHDAGRVTATLNLGVSNVDAADLPNLWPKGVAKNPRAWVTRHVLGGIATHGAMSISVEADDGFNDVAVTKANTDLDGENIAFTWMDDVPPVEQSTVHLHMDDPDRLGVTVTGGRQKIRDNGPTLGVSGDLTIVGLTYKDQTATIHARVTGPVTSAMTLLSEPRLRLLSAHPLGLKVTGGDVSASLQVDLPLENNLTLDDVQIHAINRIENGRIAGVVAGNDLTHGAFDIDVDKNGLTLKGSAALSAIPVTLDASMDFRDGPASQVVQKVTAAGKASAAQLAAAGLPIADELAGPVGLNAVYVQRRGGDSSVGLRADLTASTLNLAPLAWSKPAGVAASASANLVLGHDRLLRIAPFALTGDGFAVDGDADLADDNARVVHLNTIRLGRTEARGEVSIGRNDAISVTLRGPEIDLSAKLIEPSKPGRPTPPPPDPQPRWSVDARFDHAILANGEGATGLTAKTAGAGGYAGTLQASGTLAGGGNFAMDVGTSGGVRRLSVRSSDAGRFLRGLDAVRGMRDGRLTIDGTFGGPLGFFPLSGTARIEDVVVRNSPWLGKLLQAITLYGLADVLRGPGMRFAHVVVPFQYDGADLRLTDAQATNPSLGLTATGRLMLNDQKVDVGGTLVPAYFFNVIPGELPLIGKLFSPEKGSGVFAARFSVTGRLDDPDVTINPVSALTPGFLREIFNIFNRRGK